jgi:hypothetical protein
VIIIPILIKDMVSNLRITSKESDQNSGEVDLNEIIEAIEIHLEENRQQAAQRQYRDSSNL